MKEQKLRVEQENLKMKEEKLRLEQENLKINQENLKINQEKLNLQRENLRSQEETVRLSIHVDGLTSNWNWNEEIKNLKEECEELRTKAMNYEELVNKNSKFINGMKGIATGSNTLDYSFKAKCNLCQTLFHDIRLLELHFNLFHSQEIEQNQSILF